VSVDRVITYLDSFPIRRSSDLVNRKGSDSAMLDNTLEFLVMSGMDLPLAVMITIPEPWANNDTISQEKRDFYQYYAIMMEPWDRSEEHTSELQSRFDLVCRLLL